MRFLKMMQEKLCIRSLQSIFERRGIDDMTFEELLELSPYSLDKDQKNKILTERLKELTAHHIKKCHMYNSMLESMNYEEGKAGCYIDLPFLPVRLFKELDLKSIADEEVVKTMTSSGTSGQRGSKIYLDKVTSTNQQKAMVKIVNDFTGNSRMPMIIIDCPSVIKNREMFSARGAGILGFSIFGAKKIYALDDEMKLDVEQLREFLDKYKDQKILLFGFTFMVWQHFYKELERLKGEGITFDLSNAVLIHGGGWKKLINEAVSPEEFHSRLKNVCGLDRIHDYYGMVEQTGCIYMQCECGHLHASNFSDVIIRNPIDFSECKIGERGIIQVVSTIPESYPGHSLLTEDEGAILGEDDCPCGRKGKYFEIYGRLKNAEIRGCSDTYASDFSARNNQGGIGGIQYLVGDEEILGNQKYLPALKPFDEGVVAFLDSLSKIILKEKSAKKFSDVVTLGFWLRKASVLEMKKQFDDNQIRLGRGVVFHIAPSNVAVNYAYSLFTGLICGNANVVRIPSKGFKQIDIINKCIAEALKEHEEIKPYICLVRYERDKSINDYLSSMCNVRVIWGGDRTIEELRKSPLNVKAKEITFADRYSIAIIDSDMYLGEYDADKVASDFYNDTYFSDQNACTSPRIVVWTGNRIEEAKVIFWQKLVDITTEKYIFQPVMGVDKLARALNVASKKDILGDSKLVSGVDNRLYRMLLSDASDKIMDYRENSGFFYEYDCKDIMEIRALCDNVRCQTVAYIGKADMMDKLINAGIKGIDRVVDIGKTMDFTLEWDGYNLVNEMTRVVSI